MEGGRPMETARGCSILVLGGKGGKGIRVGACRRKVRRLSGRSGMGSKEGGKGGLSRIRLMLVLLGGAVAHSTND